MMRLVNAAPPHIRYGRTDDLPALAAFTQNTFHWGDYVPSAWAQWVKSKRGELLVAEVNDVFAGTVHVRYLENREAWLEGVRVHPDFRRQNIATTLIKAAHSHARKKHCRVIRLETGDHNTNARRLFEKFGYRCLVEYTSYQADARAGAIKHVRPAKLKDVPACLAIWQSSWLRRDASSVIPAPYGWRWWQLTPARLSDSIRAKNAWVTTNARAFMFTRRDDSFDVQLLAGYKRSAMHLLEAARVLAQQANCEKAFWVTPNVTRAKQWADAAGFSFDEAGMMIYEYVL